MNEQKAYAASCKYTVSGTMASVNLVFTRPEFRRRRYAETLVYRVTKLALDAGYLPMLYTDADYAASNACATRKSAMSSGEGCVPLAED